ncbi:MAG: bifunctional chorismate mutase/prephenate dehydratase [Clostridiaceae bacterium]|jgi:chorismate mutase/prephenate dehydratase|nr:prephenate dehydratase domain-containing protein [Bacillota bacterium]NLN51418.1 bifunctional chorismate mutase/prephenate dehydratase [Clostridiaceae bacterium]
MSDDLKRSRKKINEVDRQMADLFEQRMKLSEKVAAYKKQHGLQVYVPEREEEMIRNNSNWIKDQALTGYYSDFLRQTMRISRSYQDKLLNGMNIGYSGIEGAYAHIAAQKLFPTARKKSYHGFKATYDAVVNGDCDVAILPLENSSAGEVGQVTDLIFSGPLFINATYELTISHDLIGIPGASLEDIRTVISHPQALDQCTKYIKENDLKQLTSDNTALAAQYVAEQQDATIAAIASEDSAELYGLEILVSGINTAKTNTTRFAILSAAENKAINNKREVHFALMFTVAHEAGSLARALNIIGAHGYNLRTLRSRPMPELMWQYYFYAEADGNIYTPDGQDMLEALQLCCNQVKMVGSFVKQKAVE